MSEELAEKILKILWTIIIFTLGVLVGGYVFSY